MPDQDFEQAFAQLAYAELSQKAPGLMQYLIGFQLLKKNEDDSHAVGVFGFRVGDQWYYATPFWLNGKVKGFDLLYIVSQDMFVPLQETWVNYVTNRQPYVLGETEPKDLQQLGVSTPDFYPFRRSPLNKTSSFEEWCVPELMYKDPQGEKYAGLIKRCSVTAVMKRSPEFTRLLLNTMQKSSAFTESLYVFYTPAEIAEAAESARVTSLFTKRAVEGSTDITDLVSSDKGNTVHVAYGTGNIGPDEIQELTADQRKDLMRGDAVVDDKRRAEEKSEVYANIQRDQVFQSPNKSGSWSVLLKDGSYVDAIVSFAPLTQGKAKSTAGICIVVDSETKEFCIADSRAVVVCSEVNTLEWPNDWDKFSESRKANKGDFGMFVTKDYKCTLPFKVSKVTTSEEGEKTLCVDPITKVNYKFEATRDEDDYPKPLSRSGGCCCPESCSSSEIDWVYDTWDAPMCDNGAGDDAPYDSEEHKNRCRAHHIKLVPYACETAVVADTLIMCADNVKFVPLKSNANKRNRNNKGTLQLGTEADLEVKLQQIGMRKLSMTYDGAAEISVVYDGVKSRRMSKGACIANLIKKAGMSEDDARLLVKQVRTDSKLDVLVKEAQPLPLTTQPSQYSAEYGAPMQEPYANTALVDNDNNSNRDVYNSEPVVDRFAQDQAANAAQKGQKDVFDMSVLAGLAKTTQVADKIDEFLKDIILGNDRVGRLLFMFYWHNEQFIDQYGDEDMTELEDLLRNVFESTGDLVLFLKQKSVEPEAIASGSVISI